MISKVTITGADDSVRHDDLVRLSRQYPFVEWGILLSKSSAGLERFPSLEWLYYLAKYKDSLNLSGHICGYWIREMLSIGDLVFKGERPELWDLFSRYQFNFHGVASLRAEDLTPLYKSLELEDKQFIFQIDGVNEDLFLSAYSYGANVAPLFDLSHGAGVCPDTWPTPISRYCGYAGGLGPDNLATEIDRILKVAEPCNIWIDMETKVRSDDDMLFDLGKVEQCLEIAKPYVLTS